MQLVTGISKEAFAIFAFLCNVFVMSDSGLVIKLNPWVQYKTVRARLEVLLFYTPRTLTFPLIWVKVCTIQLDHICFEKSSSTFWQVRCCEHKTRRSCPKYSEDIFCGLLRKPKLYQLGMKPFNGFCRNFSIIMSVSTHGPWIDKYRAAKMFIVLE